MGEVVPHALRRGAEELAEAGHADRLEVLVREPLVAMAVVGGGAVGVGEDNAEPACLVLSVEAAQAGLDVVGVPDLDLVGV